MASGMSGIGSQQYIGEAAGKQSDGKEAMGECQKEISRLSYELATLEDFLGSLVTKLNPVLTPSSPAVNKVEGIYSNPLTLIGDLLAEEKKKVERMNALVADVLSRISI